jgi:uroporphyrinogen-III synthase
VPSLRALVTRPREQAQELADELRTRGFEPVVEPLIAIEPVSDEPIDVSTYDFVIVTSPNGARELARRLRGTPAQLAAIGPGTAAALESVGLRADVVADVHTQEGLVA